MPNPQIAFPASFTPASAVAFANTDNTAQTVSAATPLPVTLVGGGGASLADQSVVDGAGVFWLVRDNGVALSYLNWATGAVGVPTGPVAPAGKLTGEQVRGTQYNATAAGSGYAVGDVIEHIVILNIATVPVSMVTSAWVNITQGTVISAPPPASIAEIDASVVVGNFPATQAVSGAVTANLGTLNGAALDSSVQAVRSALGSPFQAGGAIANTSFGAVQQGAWSVGLSGSLPAGANALGSVSVSNFPATQPVSGTLAVSNLPASVGVKAGAASLSVVPASDVANLEPGGVAITGSAMPAGGVGLTGWMSAVYKACAGATPAGTAHIGSVSLDDVADAATTSASVTGAATVLSASTMGFMGGSFQVISAGTGCTITFEQSNDNATWVTLPVTSGSNGANSTATSTTSTGLYAFSCAAAYVRARVSTYGSGTVTVALTQKRQTAPTSGVALAGSTANIGNVNNAVAYVDSITALAASATYTGTARNFTTSNAYNAFMNAVSQADQAGTLYIEASFDSGATYLPLASVAASALTNAAGTTTYVAQARVALAGQAAGGGAFYRVVYKNGATAQGTFRIASSFTAG